MQGVRLIAGRPFEGSDTPGNNQACRTSFSQPYAVPHPLMYCSDGFYYNNRLLIVCLLCGGQPIGVISHLVSFVRILD